MSSSGFLARNTSASRTEARAARAGESAAERTTAAAALRRGDGDAAALLSAFGVFALARDDDEADDDEADDDDEGDKDANEIEAVGDVAVVGVLERGVLERGVLERGLPAAAGLSTSPTGSADESSALEDNDGAAPGAESRARPDSRLRMG